MRLADAEAAGAPFSPMAPLRGLTPGASACDRRNAAAPEHAERPPGASLLKPRLPAATPERPPSISWAGDSDGQSEGPASARSISRDSRDSWANSPPPSGASGSLSWERVREALGRYRGAKTPSPREGVALGLVETKDEADAAPPV